MKCLTKYCRRAPRKGRRLCHTCRGRAYTARHPDVVAFNNLKKSAKRREIDFSLTIEDFRRFAAKYDYMDKRGRHALGYTVDRVRDWEGYHAGNLQVLTNSQNVAKENALRREAFVYAKIYGWGEWHLEPF